MRLVAEVVKCVPKVVANVLAEGRVARSALLLASLALAAGGLLGCAKAKFDKQDFNAVAQAGQYTKPKIDILVFQDISTSMIVPMNTIKGQFRDFINGLDSRWDYHFTVLPLQGFYPLSSKFILALDCKGINSSYCLTSSQKDSFNNAAGDAGWINSYNAALGSEDLGFKSMTDNLNQNALYTSNFLRPDAATAIIIISNGDDLSAIDNANQYISAATLPGIYIDPNGDGRQQINYALPAYANAEQSFESFLGNFKNNNQPKRVFSVVAANNYSNCHGGSAWQGRRYMDVVSALGGNWYDFCSDSVLNNVLSTISSDMNSMMQAFVFSDIVLDAAPVVSSLQIKKNGTLIPQDNTNGWSYIGYQTNQPTVTYPSPSNTRTGYFVQLNGSATYKGTDVITIQYQKQ